MAARSSYTLRTPNNNLKHFPRVESAIHEMKIESTAVEMFWKEKNTVFCAFIANICPEKK